MERLTFEGNFCDIAMCGEVRGGSFCEYGVCSQREVWVRLKAIEDILGDEYDLDRLHELAQADREGRCVIAPVRPGEIAWCGFKQQDPIKGTEKHVVYPVVLRGWWTGIVGTEYDPRHFDFDRLYDSEESAQAALQREQDE